MISTSDIFTGQYKSEAVFIGQILGRLEIEARAQGWRGTELASIEWLPANQDRGPLATIAIKPADSGSVSIEQCRAALKEQRSLASRRSPPAGRRTIDGARSRADRHKGRGI